MGRAGDEKQVISLQWPYRSVGPFMAAIIGPGPFFAAVNGTPGPV